MAKLRTIQILRGTTEQNDAYTGSAGELTMDTTMNRVRIHDGSTVGGHNVSGLVDSVNGKTGDVVLVASDVNAATTAQGALADTAVQPGDLASVAITGSYEDLSNTPTIGDATITIKQGGVTKGVITTNQSDDAAINLDAAGVTPTDYITASSNGSNWYKRHNSGFVIQGGTADVTSTSGSVELTLPVALSTVLGGFATPKEETLASQAAIKFTNSSRKITIYAARGTTVWWMAVGIAA